MKNTDIARLLPAIVRSSLEQNSDNPEGCVLNALIKTMEKMHEPTENLLSHLQEEFNPLRARESLLPMLAHWLNIDRLYKPESLGDQRAMWACRAAPTDIGYLRELLARAVELSRWRGTCYGLQEMLSTATGINTYFIHENVGIKQEPETGEWQPDLEGEPIPFHILVVIPEGARRYMDLIKRIIDQEKPAYVTATILERNRMGTPVD